MAEFVKTIEEYVRMCETYDDGCTKCPLNRDNNGYDLGCSLMIIEKPKEAEEIIVKWAKEHPIKTNKDKFKEIFDCELTLEGCAGFNCDGREDCDECPYRNFWESEYKLKGAE